MPDVAPVKAGDWVRFMKDGRLVVGVVAYVESNRPASLYRWRIIMDIGEIVEESIVEVRRAI